MSNNRTNKIERFAAMFKALSNPNRLKIFLSLVSCCPSGEKCCTTEEISQRVGELVSQLDVAPSTVSHHIKELHNAGLIRIRRSGQTVQCCVDEATLRELQQYLLQPVAK